METPAALLMATTAWIVALTALLGAAGGFIKVWYDLGKVHTLVDSQKELMERQIVALHAEVAGLKVEIVGLKREIVGLKQLLAESQERERVNNARRAETA